MSPNAQFDNIFAQSSSSLASGLHKYVGDVDKLKLRIAFTNLGLLAARPNFVAATDKQRNKQKVLAGGHKYPVSSSFILSKARASCGGGGGGGEWQIKPEEGYSRITFESGEQLELQVISKKSNPCAACLSAAALENGNKNYRFQGDQTPINGMNEGGNRLRPSSSGFEGARRGCASSPLVQAVHSIDELTKRKRAFNWKDTAATMTSDNTTTTTTTSNFVWQQQQQCRTFARKLPNEMRNHHWPRCQSKFIASQPTVGPYLGNNLSCVRLCCCCCSVSEPTKSLDFGNQIQQRQRQRQRNRRQGRLGALGIDDEHEEQENEEGIGNHEYNSNHQSNRSRSRNCDHPNYCHSDWYQLWMLNRAQNLAAFFNTTTTTTTTTNSGTSRLSTTASTTISARCGSETAAGDGTVNSVTATETSTITREGGGGDGQATIRSSAFHSSKLTTTNPHSAAAADNLGVAVDDDNSNTNINDDVAIVSKATSQRLSNTAKDTSRERGETVAAVAALDFSTRVPARVTGRSSCTDERHSSSSSSSSSASGGCSHDAATEQLYILMLVRPPQLSSQDTGGESFIGGKEGGEEEDETEIKGNKDACDASNNSKVLHQQPHETLMKKIGADDATSLTASFEKKKKKCESNVSEKEEEEDDDDVPKISSTSDRDISVAVAGESTTTTTRDDDDDDERWMTHTQDQMTRRLATASKTSASASTTTTSMPPHKIAFDAAPGGASLVVQQQQQQQAAHTTATQRQLLWPKLNQLGTVDSCKVVCLAVIVIDVLNRFIQLKPDLDSLISIDICTNFGLLFGFGSSSGSGSGFGGYSGGVGDGTSNRRESNHQNQHQHHQQQDEQPTGETWRNNSREKKNHDDLWQQAPQIQSSHQQSSSSSSHMLLYWLEFIRQDNHGTSALKLGASASEQQPANNDNNNLTLTAPEQELNLVYKHLLSKKMSSSSCWQTSSSLLSSLSAPQLSNSGFLSPVNGSVLIKLQLDIHFASDFSDCRNLYVKYKLLAKTKSCGSASRGCCLPTAKATKATGWKLRRLGNNDDDINRAANDANANHYGFAQPPNQPPNQSSSMKAEMQRSTGSLGSCSCSCGTTTPHDGCGRRRRRRRRRLVDERSNSGVQKLVQSTHLLAAHELSRQQQRRQPSEEEGSRSRSSNVVVLGLNKPKEKSTWSSAQANVRAIDDESPSSGVAESTTAAAVEAQTSGGGGGATSSALNYAGLAAAAAAAANDDDDGDKDKIAGADASSLILLEGSTITSRPNSREQFHFACVEQLVFELQPPPPMVSASHGATTRSSSSSSSHQFRRQKSFEQLPTHTTAAATSANVAAAAAAAAAKKETETETETTMLPLDPVTTLSHYEDESTSTSTSSSHKMAPTKNSRIISIMAKEADDNDGDDDEQQQQQQLASPSSFPSTFSLSTTTSGRRRSHQPTDNDLRAPVATEIDHNLSLGWEFTKHQQVSENDPNQEEEEEEEEETDDDVCELILLFELYSSDFYQDKLQGCSHLSLPICLKTHAPNLSQSNNNNSSTGGQIRYELPVIAPELQSTLDKLRYYLIGQPPKCSPSIESFARSNHRYMLQTKQRGKLVLDCEVVRQFSDPNFDTALRNLLTIGKESGRRRLRTTNRQADGRSEETAPINTPDPENYATTHSLLTTDAAAPAGEQRHLRANGGVSGQQHLMGKGQNKIWHTEEDNCDGYGATPANHLIEDASLNRLEQRATVAVAAAAVNVNDQAELDTEQVVEAYQQAKIRLEQLKVDSSVLLMTGN